MERKDFIEYYELEYSVISKKETNDSIDVKEVLQIWIENEQNAGNMINNLKLIPLYQN